MPIRPDEFYQAARNLNELKPPLVSDEVCARTMLNRMYYAAYLATREAVRNHLGNPRFNVTHTALATALAEAADPAVSALGSRLALLKTAREQSDYQPHLSITRGFAALHLVNARYVLDNASRLVGRFPYIKGR